MVDKAISVRRERIGSVVGRLSEDLMLRVTRALSVWVGIA